MERNKQKNIEIYSLGNNRYNFIIYCLKCGSKIVHLLRLLDSVNLSAFKINLMEKFGESIDYVVCDQCQKKSIN